MRKEDYEAWKAEIELCTDIPQLEVLRTRVIEAESAFLQDPANAALVVNRTEHIPLMGLLQCIHTQSNHVVLVRSSQVFLNAKELVWLQRTSVPGSHK